MLNCRFKPIDQWPIQPTPNGRQKKSPFKALWSQTLDLLERELNHLRARNIIIDGYFSFAHIRNDGWPKSNARPAKPGIILSFDTKRGRMMMPCDTYLDWEANVRAIALTLESLRTIERYGVTTDQQEQYTGWLKLNAANPEAEVVEHAKTLLRLAGIDSDAHTIPFSSSLTGQLLNSPDEFERVWKAAARRTHPDTGGSSETFQAVMTARDRIKTLKGWS